MLKNTVVVLLLLYVCALHSSMAAMEITGWLLTIISLACFRDLQILRANRALIAWLAALVIAVLIPLITEPQQKSILFQFGYMRWTVLLWGLVFSLQAVFTPQFERRFLNIWMVGLSVAGAYGFLQFLTGWDFIRTGKLYDQGNGIFKAVGFFSFSMTYAYVMGISTVALSLPAFRQNRKMAVAACVFGALGVVASTSRGSLLGVAICGLIYLAFKRPKWLIPAFVALLLVGATLNRLSEGFSERIGNLVKLKLDDSSITRLNLWHGYWQMFLDHPLFGIGLVNGDKVLPEYFTRLGIHQEFVSHAHNNFLQFLAGAGLFGFICYSAVISIVMYKAWRLRLIEPAWGWSLFLAQVFLHLGGLTEANFINTSVNHFLLLTWALTLVLEKRNYRSET